MGENIHRRSADLFERLSGLAGWSQSKHPPADTPLLYARQGSGCQVVDVDGVERIDFANNMASLIHGHAHPAIIEAVTTQLKLGTAFTMATEAELLYAEQLCGRSPDFDKVRFVNSGRRRS